MAERFLRLALRGRDVAECLCHRRIAARKDRNAIEWCCNTDDLATLDALIGPKVAPFTCGKVDINRVASFPNDGSDQKIVTEEILIGEVCRSLIVRKVQRQGAHQR